MKIIPFLCGALLLTGIAARADDDLRAVQQQLKTEGYYFGTADGAAGKETTDALRRYQIRNGLEVSGKLDEQTRAALQKGDASASAENGNAAPSVPPPPASTPAPRADLRAERDDAAGQDREFLRKDEPRTPAPAERAEPAQEYAQLFRRTPYESAPPVVQRDTVRRAKARLAQAGYYQGAINEIPSPRLADALRAFQERRGMEPSGRLDLDTLSRLRLMPPMERAPRPGPAMRGVWLR